VSDRPIFRESAVEAFRRGTEKDIVPRVIARPIVICLWLFLGALLAGVLIAWSVKVPSYAGATGVVLGARDHATRGVTSAVLFVTPDERAQMRVGRSVHAQVGSSGTHVPGMIVKVEPGLIGPRAAARRYRLHAASDVIDEPSQAVIVKLSKALSGAAYDGSRLTAKVQVGSRRLLKLFRGLGSFAAGG
jgi:hypothetical protein